VEEKRQCLGFYLCNVVDWKLFNPLLICKIIVEMWNELINTFELKAIENIHRLQHKFMSARWWAKEIPYLVLLEKLNSLLVNYMFLAILDLMKVQLWSKSWQSYQIVTIIFAIAWDSVTQDDCKLDQLVLRLFKEQNKLETFRFWSKKRRGSRGILC
jgi:hypothetical protein